MVGFTEADICRKLFLPNLVEAGLETSKWMLRGKDKDSKTMGFLWLSGSYLT